MSTLTPNFGFILPGVNDPTDQDLWGGMLNSNWMQSDSFYQDNNFRLLNAADTSKKLAFSLSAITTSTVRTLTVRDINGILPVIASNAIGIPSGGAGTADVSLKAPDGVTSAVTSTLPPLTGTLAQREDIKSFFGAFASSITAGQIPFDGTTPQNTEGTEIFSIPFSTRYANSTVRVILEASGDCAALVTGMAALFVDAGVSAVASKQGTTAVNPGHWWNLYMVADYVPGSTAEKTYRIRIGGDLTGRLRLNNPAGGSGPNATGAHIIIQEILA